MIKFYTHKIIINKEQSSKRLDLVITKKLEKYTRSQVKLLIENNNVKMIDEIINKASYKVKVGDEFTITIPKINITSYEPENIPLNIKYEDNDIIVLESSTSPDTMISSSASPPANSNINFVANSEDPIICEGSTPLSKR